SKTSDEVIALLQLTGRKFHQTIVMITHNPEIANQADRCIQIEDGRVAQGADVYGKNVQKGRLIV
ncbi:MAG: hypothetical protein K2M91_07985, partial [Lachnospiraceae bacterium]|nr:hypothetical protein [Lachnospiraceae bacterium]